MEATNLSTPESLISGPDLEEMLFVASATPAGAFIEVGVYKGGSAWKLAELVRDQSRRLYLCDTFAGIPFSDHGMGDKHEVGEFGDVWIEKLQLQFYLAGYQYWVEWVIGVFPGSWDLSETEFAFAHLDCDQYQSYKDSCEWLIPRMVPGGVIWFDDVDRLAGATRAAEELFGSRLQRGLSHPYVRFD